MNEESPWDSYETVYSVRGGRMQDFGTEYVHLADAFRAAEQILTDRGVGATVAIKRLLVPVPIAERIAAENRS